MIGVRLTLHSTNSVRFSSGGHPHWEVQYSFHVIIILGIWPEEEDWYLQSFPCEDQLAPIPNSFNSILRTWPHRRNSKLYLVWNGMFLITYWHVWITNFSMNTISPWGGPDPRNYYTKGSGVPKKNVFISNKVAKEGCLWNCMSIVIGFQLCGFCRKRP